MSRREQGDGAAGAALSRRRFLGQVASAAGLAALLGAGLGLTARQAGARPDIALRPPGALAEASFVGACLRCGQCVTACPYDTLRLAALGDGVAPGTPWFSARAVPCEMCPDIPCVKACPSGALDPALEDINRSRMGTAVLVDHENCINLLGLRCDVCYRVCPRIDAAITLEMRRNERTGRHAIFVPTVHADECTGCGKCEHACVLEDGAAIRVLPTAVARGAAAAHYRLGWEEKEKAGGPLLPGIEGLPARRPGGAP